jgi:hypothetical protein
VPAVPQRGRTPAAHFLDRAAIRFSFSYLSKNRRTLSSAREMVALMSGRLLAHSSCLCGDSLTIFLSCRCGPTIGLPPRLSPACDLATPEIRQTHERLQGMGALHRKEPRSLVWVHIPQSSTRALLLGRFRIHGRDIPPRVFADRRSSECS